MTGPTQDGSIQTVDPVVIKGASMFTYWALVGIAAILAWIAVDIAIALALAPIALLLIEAVATRIAARVVS